ncbi:winged helix DNA-binding protein [uncultured Porphyromonas sp.]|jgi:DNA-binding MarR family transcriptional regulator|uniref:MarR family winged helix-turn-helix transcriptional regulator n=1 Tax=uncultured Porphyromonas sp. TaxID=159274 RepID=UPI00260563C2|nr:winged helix DNA-binding protein [uncultured Porphyromonas sp.]
MSYPLLHELLDLVERYEEFRGNAEQSMSNFLRFADQTLEQQTNSEEPKVGMGGHAYLNAMIARDISFVYRYMRYFVRKAIKDTPLQTIDEYSYLITLMAKGEMTKTELNNYNVVEKTSGSEIIRRLLKGGLISQTRNLQDRRSLLLSITPKGREVVKELLPRMQQSSDLLLRDLSWDQKIFLHSLHEQLYESNHPLFLTERDSDLAELVEKVPIDYHTR